MKTKLTGSKVNYFVSQKTNESGLLQRWAFLVVLFQLLGVVLFQFLRHESGFSDTGCNGYDKIQPTRFVGILCRRFPIMFGGRSVPVFQKHIMTMLRAYPLFLFPYNRRF